MRRRLALFACACALLGTPAPARAEAWEAVYDAYVAGANVVRLSAAFRLDAAGYRLVVQSRTLGLLDWFVGSRQSSEVEGDWRGTAPSPRQFRAEGVWKGKQRQTWIDFTDGLPHVRDLRPAERHREPIPPALRQDALDRLSPLALLARQAARTGTCEGIARTYDGRRLEQASARTAGWEELPAATVSPFAGRALRCDIELRQTAGFTPEEDPAEAGRPRQAQVWLAPPFPGAPMLPVRLRLQTNWLGSATVYLTVLQPATP